MRPLFYPACGAAAIALSFHVAQSFGDAPGPSAERPEQWNQAREQPLQQRAEILDARLVGFKASLALTSDQEKNWLPSRRRCETPPSRANLGRARTETKPATKGGIRPSI